MKKLLLLLLLAGVKGKAQRIVYHTDLVPQTLTNSAFKTGMHTLYAGKLDAIATDRSSTAASASAIEEVQRKVFNSLTNVDEAIRNGKTLFYISRKIPLIFQNLQTASALAIGKPYLLTIASQQANMIVQRVINLQAYLQNFVLASDPKVLITPTDRDRFVHEVYDNINIIYAISAAMVSTFKLYGLQEAVNKVVPLQMYVNMDKIIIRDMAKKVKF